MKSECMLPRPSTQRSVSMGADFLLIDSQSCCRAGLGSFALVWFKVVDISGRIDNVVLEIGFYRQCTKTV